MMRTLFSVSILCILAISVTWAAAQQLSMRHFSRDEGLAQNDVNRIYQSHQGYLWVGTYAGLSRFDGKRFETFDETTSGLGGTVVKTITEDVQGHLWVGYTGGIARLEGTRFVNFTPRDGLLGYDVVDVWPDPKAGLWIVTEKGVNYFNNGNFSTYPLRGIDESRYSHITGTPTGRLFVAFQEGVYEWQPERRAFEPSPVLTFRVQALHYNAHDGFIYLIDDTTLYRYKEGTLTQVATSPASSSPLIDFAFGREQTFWLYSDQEIWQWRDQSSEVYTNALLQGASISQVLEDREGNLWLGNWGRLSMLVNPQIRHYTRGLPGNIVTDIHEDPTHHLWIACNKGIVKLSPQGMPIKTIDANYVNAMIQLQPDTLLVATYYDGLQSYDLQGRFLQQVSDKPFNIILLATDGTYWLGGYHGLYAMTNGHMALALDTTSPWLKSNVIWSLLEDRQGRIWVGTENGLVRKDTDDTWQYFDTTHGLPHQAVWSLVEHPTWGVLVGTDKGAARWTGQRFEAVPWHAPLIEFMAVDPQKRLWVGTGDGIYRVNQHQHIDLFLDKARGLPTSTPYINSVFVGDTAIYVGTYNGLVRIDLNIENDRMAVPLLDVYQLDIDGKASPISLLSQPLSHFNKNLTFRFNGIYMYLPDSVTYRYYLDGFDHDWHQATPINQAVYTNLSPGDYTFSVQALAEGKKASPVQQITFRLLPPFWQTWWAYGLYLILGVTAVWGITRVQVQRVRRKAELQLREKQRQLQEKQRFLDASVRFVPGEFLAYLQRESIVEVELGDCVEQTISVLFSDIRSFTTLSEQMRPEENFAFLNSYLSHMGPLIRNHRGFIDKYIGDAIMALFGHDADDAVQAGLAMLRELHTYNTAENLVQVPINMGIGIHRGPMMLGTIGEAHRLETTVISDAVNLAARLEGMTKIYGVSLLISEQLLQSLHHPDHYATRIIDRVLAKGKDEPTTIYEVYNADPPHLFAMKERTKKVFEEGVLLYNAQDLTHAKGCFQACLAKNPEDKAAALFLERCTHYINAGRHEAWTGVTPLEIK